MGLSGVLRRMPLCGLRNIAMDAGPSFSPERHANTEQEATDENEDLYAEISARVPRLSSLNSRRQRVRSASSGSDISGADEEEVRQVPTLGEIAARTLVIDLVRTAYDWNEDQVKNLEQMLDCANIPTYLKTFILEAVGGPAPVDHRLRYPPPDSYIVRRDSNETVNDRYLTFRTQDRTPNEEIIRVISRYPQVVSLDLSDCIELTNGTLVSIAKQCSRIRALWINTCYCINSRGLRRFCKRTPDLVTLEAERCINIKDDVLIELPNLCPRLQNINLNYCKHITDRGMASLTQLRLGSLRARNCMRLTDSTLKMIGEECPSLQLLDLSYCIQLTDVGVVNMFTQGQMRHLRHINLRGCHNLSIGTTRCIAVHAKQMEYIDLYDCPKVPWGEFLIIVQECSNVQTYISNAFSITDASPRQINLLLRSFGSSAPSIEGLSDIDLIRIAAESSADAVTGIFAA
eukprot:Clim_evm19s225 gene=Clim_evmTU19s225